MSRHLRNRFLLSLLSMIMLGAFARTTGLVRLESLQAALRGEGGLRDAALEQNLAALARGHEATAVHAIERRAAA